MNLNNSFFKIIMFLSVFSLIVSCKEQANTKKNTKHLLHLEIMADTNINQDIDTIYKVFFKTGGLKYSVGIKDSLKHGEEIEYYENGKVKMRGSRLKGNEKGFYFYYGIEGKLDSIIEYVIIDTNNPFQSYLNPDSFTNKEVIINRSLIFDKNGNVDKEKSLFFSSDLLQDTISISDTLFARIGFLYPTNNETNNFKVYYSYDKFDKAIVSQTTRGDDTLYFHIIANQRGNGIIKGLIEEEIKDGSFKYFFFEKSYYVK